MCIGNNRAGKGKAGSGMIEMTGTKAKPGMKAGMKKRDMEEIYVERKERITKDFNVLINRINTNEKYLKTFGGVGAIEKMAEVLMERAEQLRLTSKNVSVDLFDDEEYEIEV